MRISLVKLELERNYTVHITLYCQMLVLFLLVVSCSKFNGRDLFWTFDVV